MIHILWLDIWVMMDKDTNYRILCCCWVSHCLFVCVRIVYVHDVSSSFRNIKKHSVQLHSMSWLYIIWYVYSICLPIFFIYLYTLLPHSWTYFGADKYTWEYACVGIPCSMWHLSMYSCIPHSLFHRRWEQPMLYACMCVWVLWRRSLYDISSALFERFWTFIALYLLNRILNHLDWTFFVFV